MYDKIKMEKSITLFLEAIGEDLENENIKETPKRTAKMWEVLLGGYNLDPKQHIKLFPATSNNMVTLANIPIFSFCSHHILPFLGTIAVAYIPDKNIIGISKLARIARTYAKQLNVQEDLTNNIAQTLQELLSPKGVAVQIRAQHLCTILRGVRAHGAVMTTTALTGLFKEDEKARLEFLDTIKRENNVFSY